MSMQPAISVRGLSKVYRVERSGASGGARELGETLVDWVKSPLHRLRHGAAHGRHAEEFWALRGIDFEVAQGEVLGIVGRNGAGKSTLLKILSRITSPTAGRIVLEGRVGSLLEIGTGFHPDLSGRENVFLNGAILGMTNREIKQRFDEIVEFSGISKFIDTPVKRYSSGMRVRLGFGVAAYLQPEILIVDEVLAVGDVEFQRRCLGKMSEAAQSGRTVLFVSHNMSAVQQLTSRCLLLEQGTITADGPTEQVIDEYFRLNTPTDTGAITESMHKFLRSARFHSVQLLDPQLRQTTTPPNFSLLQVIAELEVMERQERMIVTFGVDTVEGKSLARFSTTEAFGDGPIEPGRYRVGVEFELPISPGPYSLMVRADEGYRKESQLAVVPSAMTFELIESRKLGFDATLKPYQQSLIPLTGKWLPAEPASESGATPAVADQYPAKSG